jgi:hypothetical protein
LTYVNNKRGGEIVPRLDGTGPMGWGSMTGRGFGYCAGVDTFRYARGFRRGFGRGFARGFGRGFYYDPYTSMSDKEYLEKQKEILENQLKAINEELENL